MKIQYFGVYEDEKDETCLKCSLEVNTYAPLHCAAYDVCSNPAFKTYQRAKKEFIVIYQRKGPCWHIKKWIFPAIGGVSSATPVSVWPWLSFFHIWCQESVPHATSGTPPGPPSINMTPKPVGTCTVTRRANANNCVGLWWHICLRGESSFGPQTSLWTN